MEGNAHTRGGESQQSRRAPSIVVIGARIGGLTTAALLARAGLTVTVLEAHVYIGPDATLIPPDFPFHHQVIVREPMGEANTAYLSLSPAWDKGRAPAGQRILTISTHTALALWWQLRESAQKAYEARKTIYSDQLITAATHALPSLREASKFILAGTPITFQRFARRDWGWVGGFPQTHLWRAWGPRLAPQLWMVGDSIFPGQSTAAVALGGLRVADSILADYGRAPQERSWSEPILQGD
ncbi:MAG: hypothetical protein DYG89_46690 [Caldilinea sp. CFX5]|nr:hypothetical protein [Caldilinea sp. CFX5]